MVDIAEFETALVNLVINARDAMPDGGTITVAARNAMLEREANAGEYVAISVDDTGSGIAPDVLDKIFDPFFTTKPIGKGTGGPVAGARLCTSGRRHSQGGQRTRQGTDDHHPAAARRTRRIDDVEAVETGGSGTVLLVEDNPDVAAVSISLLEQLGYTVRRVADAEAALREIEHDGIDSCSPTS